MQKQPVPLREPDLGIFGPEQVALVDEVITGLWNMNAAETSRWSHGKAWRAAVSDGELIPYEAVFVSDAPIDQSDIARTRDLAARHGWEWPSDAILQPIPPHLRQIRHSETYDTRLAALGDIRRLDDALTGVEWALSRSPEDFGVIEGLKDVRTLKTEPLGGLPCFRVWFRICGGRPDS